MAEMAKKKKNFKVIERAEKRLPRAGGGWNGEGSKSVQSVQTFSYKMSKVRRFYVKHGDYG